ncbi:MAG: undecaprenyl-phosphate glucose phosphotransferase [Patescibacteria group bacterium]
MKRSELFFSFLLVPVDAAMIIASFVLAYWIRIKADLLPVNSDVNFHQYLWYVAYALPVWILIFALSGLYKISRVRNYFNDLYKIFVNNSVVLLIFVVAIFFGRAFFFSRLILVLILVLSVILVFLGRIIITSLQRWLYKFGYGIHNIAVIGNNEVAERLEAEMHRVSRLGMRFIGVINGVDSKPQAKTHVNLLGDLKDLKNIIKKHQPDEIILTDIGIDRKKIIEIIQICYDNNVSFKFISDIFSIVTTTASTSVLAGFPVMELKTVALDGWGRIIKRLSDIVFASVCLIIASPFMLFTAVGTLLTSSGPVIFKQKRVGRDGKVFDFYKFRSMYTDKCDFSEKGKKWTTKADDKNRITSFGKFIRKTNLDELPQFWNVLIGNMSFVGPRPELPKFVDEFQKNIPDYFRRHRVKAGLTGWAQVNGLKGDTSIEERVRFDIFYIENWSFWFDVKIIIKTMFLIIGEAFGGKYEYRSRT